MSKVLFTTLVVLLASSAFAADAATDRILLPVFFSSAGSYGSRWVTEVVAYNASESDLSYSYPLFEQAPFCTCIPGTGILSRHSRNALQGFQQSSTGLWIEIPKAAGPEDVQWSARIRDTTREAASAGTEIPLVRQSDFYSTVVALPRVMTDQRFRSALRVYGARDAGDGDVVLMRIYDARNTFQALVDTSLILHAEPVQPSSAFYLPPRPEFAMIGDLVAAYPQLASVPEIAIELRPAGTSPIWAFVSTTNNDTQQVTLVTPQK
jgi:hypothetical protein